MESYIVSLRKAGPLLLSRLEQAQVRVRVSTGS